MITTAVNTTVIAMLAISIANQNFTNHPFFIHQSRYIGDHPSSNLNSNFSRSMIPAHLVYYAACIFNTAGMAYRAAVFELPAVWRTCVVAYLSATVST